jgi:BD-FAE protein
MNKLAEIQRRSFVSGLFGGMAATALANVARADARSHSLPIGPLAAPEGPAGVDGHGSDRARCRLRSALLRADGRSDPEARRQHQRGGTRAPRRAAASVLWPERSGKARHLPRAQAERADLPVRSRRFVARARREMARNNAYPAEMFVNAGANFIAIDFIDINQAGGDLRLMAAQVRSAIAWVYKNAVSFGADANRLYVGGRSSGSHLTAVALVTDWERDYGVPADIVKGGICSSGMYDLKPVRISKRSSFVRFTDEREEAMSPRRHLDRLRAPVVVTYGTNETPEFQRQARDFAAAVKAADKSVELIEAPNYNHYEMGESFGNPYGPSSRAALALMKLPVLG